jgi:hypothetical protein
MGPVSSMSIMWIISFICSSFVNRLLGMLDDFEDDVVGLTNMDEAPQQQSDWPLSSKSSKQRTLSQMAKDAGSKPKRSKVCNTICECYQHHFLNVMVCWVLLTSFISMQSGYFMEVENCCGLSDMIASPDVNVRILL